MAIVNVAVKQQCGQTSSTVKVRWQSCASPRAVPPAAQIHDSLHLHHFHSTPKILLVTAPRGLLLVTLCPSFRVSFLTLLSVELTIWGLRLHVPTSLCSLVGQLWDTVLGISSSVLDYSKCVMAWYTDRDVGCEDDIYNLNFSLGEWKVIYPTYDFQTSGFFSRGNLSLPWTAFTESKVFLKTYNIDLYFYITRLTSYF